MRRIIIPVLAIAIGLIAPRAYATSVTWTLTGVTFSDGSTATGFFTDPSGGTLNSQFPTTGWSITVISPAGSNFSSPFTYDPSNSTEHLINVTPAIFPTNPPGGFYGSDVSITSNALCPDSTGTAFCRDIILDGVAPGLEPTLASLALDTTFSVEGCGGCAPGMLDAARGFSGGSYVPSTGGTAPTPEPSSLTLLMCALGLLTVPGVVRRRV